VRFRHGPAAVSGDEIRTRPLCSKLNKGEIAGEGAENRWIRESEDLPKVSYITWRRWQIPKLVMP